MEKTIGAFEARRNFGRILQDVAARGDRVLVERHGQPIAAVVPIQVYEQWKRRREAFFTRVRQTAEQSDLDTLVAEELADEAVRAARAHQS